MDVEVWMGKWKEIRVNIGIPFRIRTILLNVNIYMYIFMDYFCIFLGAQFFLED